MKKFIVLWSVLVLTSSNLIAHDMFLKLRSYIVEPNTKVTLALYNGTFDKSENIITRDRMIDVSVVGPTNQRNRINKNQWRDGWYESLLDLDLKSSGTHVIGLSTETRIIELSAEDFNGYLKHDGILDVLEARKKSGETNQPARELYSKHVKTVIQAGSKRTESFNTNLGYPIEIILSQNPYKLKKGDELGFQVLRDSKPVANQLVYASYSGFHEHADEGTHVETVTMRTNSKGFGKLKLIENGEWYLRLIQMVKSDKEGIDYESNWATFTFQIQ